MKRPSFAYGDFPENDTDANALGEHLLSQLRAGGPLPSSNPELERFYFMTGVQLALGYVQNACVVANVAGQLHTGGLVEHPAQPKKEGT